MFQLEELLLACLIRQVWWWWTTLPFCFGLGMSSLCLHFWSSALQFFSLNILNISSHSLLAYKVSVKKSIDSLLGGSCLSYKPFSLAFKMVCLSLTFDSFITTCAGEVLFASVWRPVSFMNMDIQISLQIWEVLSHGFIA